MSPTYNNYNYNYNNNNNNYYYYTNRILAITACRVPQTTASYKI